jgi:hypothetical protein
MKIYKKIDKKNISITLNKESITVWMMFAVLLFLAGFRWDVGVDWRNYLLLFGTDSSTIGNEHLESANLLLKYLLFSIGCFDGGYALFILAFITLFFFFYSISKYSISPIFSSILFICFGTYFELLNGVRQYVSIAMFVYSWQFLIRKQLTPYIITILVAGCFHRSSFILLFVYFVANYKINRKLLIILVCVFIPLSFISNSFTPKFAMLFSKYEIYADSNFLISNGKIISWLRIVFPTLIFLLIIHSYNKLAKINIVFTNMFIIFLFLTLLFPSTMLFIRIALYFQPSLFFIIPVLSKCYSKQKAELLNIFATIYGILFIYITYLSRPTYKLIPFNLDFRLFDSKLLFVLLVSFFCIAIFIKCMSLPRYKNKIIWKKFQS